MATLILTAVGTAVAGPIGGMVGALAGQFVDQNVLFAPKARHGPRLGELSVQTSTYGAAIPKIFGRMRVAGCVAWATDLVESRSAGGGGKGQPKLVSYSYSASFAVILSARTIRTVGRIWADGKLLRGSAGDFKTPTQYRLYLGDEDQDSDPLIASAEGADQAPAFRGLAYAVFDDFQLADYGNRIPSLTFEVEADPGPVEIGSIANELSSGEIVADPTPAIAGYAAGGDSIRSAVETLADIFMLSLSDRETSLRLSAAAGEPQLVLTEGECRRREIVRRATGSVADEVTIAHYDPARDYQTGTQRATSAGGGNARSPDRRSLAAALDANMAKALAEHRLATLRTGRVSAKTQLSWASAPIRPGDSVRLEGDSGTWKVKGLTLGTAVVGVDLVRVPETAPPALTPATPGRPLQEPDLLHGATLLRLVELPLGDVREGRPLLFAAAAGESEGWRRAALLSSFDSGGTWNEVGATALPARLGTARTQLAPGGAALIDTHSAVEIELAHAGMWLESASDDALAGGGNLALLGSELIQFGRAEHLGGRRFRLSRLLRGRRGSEWAAAGHQTGEDFLLLEKEALTPLEAPAGSVNAEARLSATGVGDGDEAATAVHPITGEALRPPSPVHLRAERLPSGAVRISWVRRSRQGWAWPSSGGTPLVEEAEGYRLEISGAGFQRVAAISEPTFLYSVEDQLADGAGASLIIAVAQLGTFAMSRTASLILA